MNKLLKFIIALVFLVGCTPQLAPDNTQPEARTIDTPKAQPSEEQKTTTPSTDKKLSQQTFPNLKDPKPIQQTAIEEVSVKNLKGQVCNTLSEESEKNMCYLSFVYSLDNKPNPTIPSYNPCEKINNDLPLKDRCNWFLAMYQKSTSTCDNISEIATDLFLREYVTKDNCKNAIHYKTLNAEWNLGGGIPMEGDEGFYYNGKAQLTGWYELVPIYVSNYADHFYVSDLSLRDLPFLTDQSRYLHINDINDKEIIEKIKNESSPEHPIKINVDRIIYYNEMNPKVQIIEIAE